MASSQKELTNRKILTLISMYRVNQQALLWKFFQTYLDDHQATLIRWGNKKYAFSEILKKLINFRIPRKIWMKRRLKMWWPHHKTYADEDTWLEKFRMTKQTFQEVHSSLKEHLQPCWNPLQPDRAVDSDEQLAVCVYFLASCAEYRIIGDVFGYHKSTVCKIVHKVCDTILEFLMPTWIKLPDEEECEIIASEFEKICGIPRIWLVLDGSHIPVRPSKEGRCDFYNRKGLPSIILQAAVDCNLL